MLHLLLLSDINVLQGSVATLVCCGGIFNVNFIANFPTSQPVKELWKSADIWRSYRKSKKGDVFCDTVYINCHIHSKRFSTRPQSVNHHQPWAIGQRADFSASCWLHSALLLSVQQISQWSQGNIHNRHCADKTILYNTQYVNCLHKHDCQQNFCSMYNTLTPKLQGGPIKMVYLCSATMIQVFIKINEMILTKMLRIYILKIKNKWIAM